MNNTGLARRRPIADANISINRLSMKVLIQCDVKYPEVAPQAMLRSPFTRAAIAAESIPYLARKYCWLPTIDE